MITVICGSREIENVMYVYDAIRYVEEHTPDFNITKVVSGVASGPDTAAIRWAEKHNVPCDFHPADWTRYGKSAGYKRNKEMVDSSEFVIALWDGKSKGTKHSIDIARKTGKPVWVFEYIS